jgi:hypothetical protein
MNRTRISIILLFLVTLAGIAGTHGGQAAAPTAIGGGGHPAQNPWLIKTIESTSGTTLGQYVSLSYHDFAEKPYISHYDATNQDLRLTYPTSSNGNCNPASDWYCEIVDSNGDVGAYSSFDYYYTYTEQKLGIAYYDATNHALKIAIWSVSPSPGWTISTIQQGNTLYDIGLYPSLQFDSNGDAHISYLMLTDAITPVDDALMYASYVGSGGNCGEGDVAGKWQCNSVESDENTGQYTSLKLAGSAETPVIACYDSSPGVVKLCVVGSGCEIIDNVGGGFPSLVIDASDHARIAYYDKTAGTLKYAKYVGTGGNCGGNAYQCDVIDTAGADLNQVGISMVIGGSGYPIIAYQDASDEQGLPVLKTARPVAAYGMTIGNCGPQVGLIYEWQCETIDDGTQGGGGGHLSEADYVSVDVDPTGLTYIAYSEYDDYYSLTRLKLAYQYRPHTVFLPLVVR